MTKEFVVIIIIAKTTTTIIDTVQFKTIATN